MSFPVSGLTPRVHFGHATPIQTPPVLMDTQVSKASLPNGRALVTTARSLKSTAPGAQANTFTERKTIDKGGRPVRIESDWTKADGTQVKSTANITYTIGVDGKMHVCCTSTSQDYSTTGKPVGKPKTRVAKESYPAG